MKFTFSNPSYSGKADKFEWANSAIIFTYDYKQNKHNSNLSSNGFGMPRTWEEFNATAKALQKKGMVSVQPINFPTFLYA